jgi:hypothetical protein
MKYTVDTEELTDVLALSTEKVWGTEEHEIPDELVERYKAAMAEFRAVQKALRDLTGIPRAEY